MFRRQERGCKLRDDKNDNEVKAVQATLAARIYQHGLESFADKRDEYLGINEEYQEFLKKRLRRFNAELSGLRGNMKDAEERESMEQSLRLRVRCVQETQKVRSTVDTVRAVCARRGRGAAVAR